MTLRQLRHWMRAVWMFLRVVCRRWDGKRIGPVEAWEIASAVWLTEFSIRFQVWVWMSKRQRWERLLWACYSIQSEAVAQRALCRRQGFCTAVSREVV